MRELVPTVPSNLRKHHRRIRTLESLRHHLHASWSGERPLTSGADGAVWRVPYIKGTAYTFDVVRMLVRLGAPGSTATNVRIEKSPGGGAFTPTTVSTVVCAAGDYEEDVTGTFGPVASGQLLRIYFASVGAGSGDYTVQLEGIAH